MADRDAESLERVMPLLLADVARTLGPTHRAYVLERAAEVRTFEIDDPGAKLVDDVQQYAHDLFIDTTWPACPRHPNHPLRYRGGAWWCEADGVAVAPLGGLPPRQAAG